MSDKKYKFWTVLCLAIAVSSAFLFDRYSQLATIIGAVGIASAIASALFYFYQERSTQPHDVRATPSAVPAIITDLSLQKAPAVPLRTDVNQLSLWANEAVHSRALDIRRRTITFHVTNTGKQQFYGYMATRQHPEIDESHKLDKRKYFVEEVVEIVQRLSETCEFEWKPTGELKIVPRATGLPESLPGSRSVGLPPGSQKKTIN